MKNIDTCITKFNKTLLFQGTIDQASLLKSWQNQIIFQLTMKIGNNGPSQVESNNLMVSLVKCGIYNEKKANKVIIITNQSATDTNRRLIIMPLTRHLH